MISETLSSGAVIPQMPSSPVAPLENSPKLEPALATEIRAVIQQATSQQSEEHSSVAAWVLSRFSRCIQVRSGFTARLTAATYAAKQMYKPEDEAAYCQEQQPLIHMGIFANKSRTVSAWVKDILTNSPAKVWTIGATPVPELPPSVINNILQIVSNEVTQMGMPAEMAQASTDVLMSIAKTHIDGAVKEGMSSLEREVDDMLTEAKFNNELAAFIDDFAVYPYAVLAGPFETADLKLTYNEQGQLVETVYPRLSVRRVNPVNFYWSPDSTTAQNGECVIEYGSISASILYDSLDLPGMLRDGILHVLSSGYAFNTISYTDIALSNLQKSTYVTLGESTNYPVIMYFGTIKAEDLIQHGIAVADPLKPVEVEVWVIGNTVVRLVENPYPKRRRPYNVTSFAKLPGSLVGMGLHDILDGVERVANAAARNLAKNMAFSAGPIAEVDESRLATADTGISSITPYRVYRVAESMLAGNSPAFRFQIIPSVAGELVNVYEMFNREADRISGLSNLLLGQTEQASNSRTASGLSMLIANASKVIKNTIGNIDRDVIEPLIENVVLWMAMHASEPRHDAIDAQVVAHGAAGALQREVMQSHTVELLTMLTQYTQMGVVPPATILLLLREVITASGYDPNVMLPQINAAQMQISNILMSGGLAPAPLTSDKPLPAPSGAGIPSTQTGGGVPSNDGRFVK